jgi:hypothetical protein
MVTFRDFEFDEISPEGFEAFSYGLPLEHLLAVANAVK